MSAPTIGTLGAVFGHIEYAIPKLGEHGRVQCWFGRHWLTVVRQVGTGMPLTLACGACEKVIGQIHDLEAQP